MILRANILAAAALASALIGAGTAAAEQRLSKDVGPANAACDSIAKGSTQWTACVGQASAALPATEAFYAGYWLAKSGAYSEALAYLGVADQNDPKVQTYIGFATRKLGNVEAALPHYARALEINPNFTVARAYLGEAYLTKNQPLKAAAELEEIANRCGTTCPEYVDLKTHISAFETAHARKG